MVTTTLCCDRCRDRGVEPKNFNFVSPQVARRQARQEAARSGWRYLHGEGKMIDVCPECSEVFYQGHASYPSHLSLG